MNLYMSNLLKIQKLKRTANYKEKCLLCFLLLNLIGPNWKEEPFSLSGYLVNSYSLISSLHGATTLSSKSIMTPTTTLLASCYHSYAPAFHKLLISHLHMRLGGQHNVVEKPCSIFLLHPIDISCHSICLMIFCRSLLVMITNLRSMHQKHS